MPAVAAVADAAYDDDDDDDASVTWADNRIT